MMVIIDEFLEPNLPLIERSPYDDPGESCGPNLVHILLAGDAARGDHFEACLRRKIGRRCDVDPSTQPVPRNVRKNRPRNALVAQSLPKLDRRNFRPLGPAADAYPAIA